MAADQIQKDAQKREGATLAARFAAAIKAFVLHEQGIIGGYDLSQDYPGLEDAMLLCVTEMNSRGEIDHLVEALKAI